MEKYEPSNKAKRFFNKLKDYRAMATHYDNHVALLRGEARAALRAISLKDMVSTL